VAELKTSTKLGIVAELKTLTKLGSVAEDTRLILHSHCKILLARGYERVIVESKDTDVFLMTIHNLENQNADVWMASTI
jgi:hypothetical protein